MKLEDFLDDDETLIWSDLSNGPGSRQRARLDGSAGDWLSGIGFTAACLAASAALMVFVHWAWVVALALVLIVAARSFEDAVKTRRARAAADTDYGLTQSRLIVFDRASSHAQSVYKGAITAVRHEKDSSVTLYGLEEPITSLQGLENSLAAYTLISKTLRPKP